MITWEIEYQDGTKVRERDGDQYEQIPRGFVKSIALYSVELDEVVVHLPTKGSPNFFYRRRTRMDAGGSKRVSFLLGIYPDFCLQLNELGEVTEIPVDIEPVDSEPF